MALSELTAKSFFAKGGRYGLVTLVRGAVRAHSAPVLINATNVHYAKVESALWIPPRNEDGGLSALRRKLDDAVYRPRIKLLKSLNIPDTQIVENLISEHGAVFDGISKAALLEALSTSRESTEIVIEGLTAEEAIRYPEYLQLQHACSPETTDDHLEVRLSNVTELPDTLRNVVASISMVDRLRETRVMSGFTRLMSERVEGAPSPASHMWKDAPVREDERWLPAAVIYGEGIFVRFEEEPLKQWEQQAKVLKHISALQDRELEASKRAGRTSSGSCIPRFLLLHTLAHLLMRRLTFECGYGSAALRERLYVSTNPNAKMAGILIYTASGDCEGSMGGLVRMGDARNFGRILQEALEEARWCSADPVCAESGRHGGQGLDGLNMAACHCCALIPETSCELFNSYLDRYVVVLDASLENVGFFS